MFPAYDSREGPAAQPTGTGPVPDAQTDGGVRGLATTPGTASNPGWFMGWLRSGKEEAENDDTKKTEEQQQERG